MQIEPRATASRTLSRAQNHFFDEMFFTVLRSATPQTGHFVLARAAVARYDRTKWPLADSSRLSR
jgi:hypothetical protein